MNCKINGVKGKGPNRISFSILATPGWYCSSHSIYFGTNREEDPRPKTCPVFQVEPPKRKKRK